MNHFEPSDPGYVPPGWDVFTALERGYYNYTLSDGNIYGSEPEDYSTDVILDRARDFIRSKPSGQPLFLYFAPFGPHGPATAAPRHVGAWEGRLPPYSLPSVNEPNIHDKPHWLRRLGLVPQETIDDRLQSTQEALMSIDEAAGAIYNELAIDGRAGNTLFIYLSNNGLLLGEHRLFNTKNLPYDMATHVPMLMRWDGHLAPGSNKSLARTQHRPRSDDRVGDGRDHGG
jgi:arylsulfatase A-like enzyme